MFKNTCGAFCISAPGPRGHTASRRTSPLRTSTHTYEAPYAASPNAAETSPRPGGGVRKSERDSERKKKTSIQKRQHYFLWIDLKNVKVTGDLDLAKYNSVWPHSFCKRPHRGQRVLCQKFFFFFFPPLAVLAGLRRGRPEHKRGVYTHFFEQPCIAQRPCLVRWIDLYVPRMLSKQTCMLLRTLMEQNRNKTQQNAAKIPKEEQRSSNVVK